MRADSPWALWAGLLAMALLTAAGPGGAAGTAWQSALYAPFSRHRLQ